MCVRRLLHIVTVLDLCRLAEVRGLCKGHLQWDDAVIETYVFARRGEALWHA